MNNNSKALEVEKQELTTTEDTERTRDNICFVPRSDIYEIDDQIVIVADVPGASENSIDITLEKNTLTISAFIEPEFLEGYSPAFVEYEQGDYQRSFRLSNEIDRDNIQATVKDGVLRLFLPKAASAMTRKINVQAG